MTRPWRSIAATLATLTCLTATACSDDTATPADEGQLPPGSPLEQALAYFPATTGTVSFLDQRRIEGRAGLLDVDADAPERTIGRWVHVMYDAAGGLLGIRAYVPLMKDSAFSAVDIEWEAAATTVSDRGTGVPGVHIWRLSDAVDFEDIEADLADAGFDREKERDLPTFRIDLGNTDDNGLVGGRYPVELWDVALVPDQRLVVSGHDVDEVLDVIESGADSLGDSGIFDQLLDHVAHIDQLEYAGMVRKQGCGQERGLFTPSKQPLTLVRLASDGPAARKDAARLPDALASHGVDATVVRKGRAVVARAPFARRLAFVKAWERSVPLLQCPGR